MRNLHMVVTALCLFLWVSCSKEIKHKRQNPSEQSAQRPTRPVAIEKLFSPTHPDPSLYYSNQDPIFQWKEVSGVEFLKFECRLNNGNWNPCSTSSMMTYSNLADGIHSLSVREVGSNEIGPEVSVSFRIDMTAPQTPTNLVSPTHPNSDQIYSASLVKFQWISGFDLTPVRDQYNLDGGTWKEVPENGKLSLESVTNGSHILSLRTKDSAGNLSEVVNKSFFRGHSCPKSPKPA